jgi:serine/threonine-protein kinase
MTDSTNSPSIPRPRVSIPTGAGPVDTALDTDVPPPLSPAELSPQLPSIPPPAAAPDPYIGVTFDGRYKIESLLGEGGMGVVYRGRHKVIDKAVAIKVLRADMARDVEITERFLREARAASAIGNPHIIDISDFGTLPDGSTYFVMEYLDGEPLTALVDKAGQPVPVTRLIRVARQIADGLAAAHERQIVHRDLKPDNIFLVQRGSEKDFVKILDFGIAKVASGTAKLTRHGSVFGTPHYMSPEQAAGAPVDRRTDIYSLGVIMYEMASGRLPFDADNFMGILTQHMYQAPVPIRALVPPQDIPPGLEAIVLKCLSKKPEHRYQSMQELTEDFDKMLDGQLPDAVGEMMARSGGFNVPADFFKSSMPVPVPATPAGLGRGRSWPLIAGIASVTAAISIVIGIFAYSQYGTASTESTTPSASVPPPVTTSPSAPASTTPPVMTAQPSPESVDVMVVVDPAHAEVFLGDKKLGVAPSLVSVPKGQTVSVTVRATGYIEQTLELDGSEKRKDVTLRARGGGRPPVKTGTTATSQPPPTRPPSTGKPPPTVGTGEIVNPWAK